METKLFGDKKITIRKIGKSDLRNAKKFQIFINSLIKEDARLLINKKATVKDEAEYIKKSLNGEKNKTNVHLVAEHDGKIVGNTDVGLEKFRRSHIGKFGIAILNGYRGAGLGEYLMSEIIKSAKKELRPRLKVIRLEVYEGNKPAINLYKKMGFKIVGKIPKQIQYKGKLISEFIMIKEV